MRETVPTFSNGYTYDPITKEYTGEIVIQQDPLDTSKWIMPDNATKIKPPETKEHEVACFRDGNWLVYPDFRGTWYNKQDQSQKIIDQINELPGDAYTDIAPTSFEEVWVIDHWEIPLSTYKDKQKTKIYDSWSEANDAPISTDKGTFEIDGESQTRITRAINKMTAKETRDWTTKDGTVVQMTKKDFNNILDAWSDRDDVYHTKYVGLKTQIDAAKTKEEVEAIVW